MMGCCAVESGRKYHVGVFPPEIEAIALCAPHVRLDEGTAIRWDKIDPVKKCKRCLRVLANRRAAKEGGR